MKSNLLGILALALCMLTANTLAYENVTPSETYGMAVNERAYILDVRTLQEWNWLGIPV